MPKQIEFEGTVHEFPDDFSDADISAALSSAGPKTPAAPAAAPPSSGWSPFGDKVSDKKLSDLVTGGSPPEAHHSTALAGAVDKLVKEPGHVAKLVGQNALLGANELVNMYGDAQARGHNALLEAADKISKMFGGPEISFRKSIPSEQAADAASKVAQMFGYQPAEPQDLGEKMIGEGSRLGAQSLGGAVALGRVATARAAQLGERTLPGLLDKFLAPYMKSPGKAIVGDTVAGTSAGAGGAVAEEAYPDSWWAPLVGQTVAGIGGGTLFSAATNSPTRIGRAVKGGMTDPNIHLDPETGLPTSNRIADTVASHIQGKANDPAAAAASIGDNAASFRAERLPVPTSGLIADDLGLLGLERGQRAKNSVGSIFTDPTLSPDIKAEYGFGARDTAQRDAALGEVQSLRPAGARPEAFPEEAARVADELRAGPAADVERAKTYGERVQTVREQPANDLQSNVMQGDRASGDIDKMYRDTRVTERERSNKLYSDPELTQARVPETPMTKLADDLHASEDPRSPLDPVVRKYVDRWRTPDEVEGAPPQERPPLTMKTVNAARAEVEADIQANRNNGEVIRQLSDIKKRLSGYTDTLADEGNDAAKAATTNYAERVRPNFREGAGGRMDARLKADPLGQRTAPSDTANNFLLKPEDTADLMQIGKLAGKEGETAANARTWLFDRLAQSGVTRDGVIDPEKITRWRNANSGVLDNVPGLRAEVDKMVEQARKGQDVATRYEGELRAAVERQKATEKEISTGPIGAAAGASPEKAVASIFSSKNPVEAAKTLKATVGRSPEGDAGLRAAVAEHFIGRVSNVTPGRVSEGDMSVSFAKLTKEFQKNEKALAQIYSPEEMQALQRARKAIEPLSRLGAAQATTGSITAESSAALDRMVEIGFKTAYGGLSGGNKFRNFKLATKTLFPNGDEQQAQRLVARAMFDPELAQLLLTRKIAEPGTPAWNAKLQKFIRWAEAGRNIDSQDEE